MRNETMVSLYKQLTNAGGSDISTIYSLILLSVITIIAKLAYQILLKEDDVKRLPLINGRKPWSFSVKAEEQNFMQNAASLIEYGFKTAGKAFRLQTDNDIHLVLSAEYADDIRNHPDLTFLDLTARDFHAGVPGFDAWTQVSSRDQIVVTTVKENLTNRGALLHEPISMEVGEVLQAEWSDNTEWHKVSMPKSSLQVMSRASTRALLGADLCRNEHWVEYIVSYIGNSYRAARDLRQWPQLLQPVVHWFIASCQDLRKDFARCHAIVNPVVEQRKRDKELRISKGLKPQDHCDSIDWIDEVANGRNYNATAAQIVLSIAGIFSSTDTLTQIIYDICDKPDLINDLRKEIVSTLTGNGWSKKCMYQLKLMDSVMKETQRLKPIAVASMHRMTIRDTVLCNGLKVPKGTKVIVSAHHSWDNSIYPNADKFDGYRFLRLRDEGSTTAQFATTSPSTIGFGHGHLACPGRFFAGDEIKIALSHIILKYDFRLVPGTKLKVNPSGFVSAADATGCIMVRRRKEEIRI